MNTLKIKLNSSSCLLPLHNFISAYKSLNWLHSDETYLCPFCQKQLYIFTICIVRHCWKACRDEKLYAESKSITIAYRMKTEYNTEHRQLGIWSICITNKYSSTRCAVSWITVIYRWVFHSVYITPSWYPFPEYQNKWELKSFQMRYSVCAWSHERTK